MNEESIKSKRIIIFSGAIIALLLLILAVFLFTRIIQNRASQETTVRVTNAQPDTSGGLTPGERQTFTLAFSKPFSPLDLQSRLTQSAIGETQTTPVAIQTSYEAQKNTLIIQTAEPLIPLTNYRLVIKDKIGKSLYDATYVTFTIQPTRVLTNNPALTKFLPYETDMYVLSYLARRNVYVFNLKLNPKSSDNYNVQFEKAKAQATQFIESKGINVNSLIIEWRRS